MQSQHQQRPQNNNNRNANDPYYGRNVYDDEDYNSPEKIQQTFIIFSDQTIRKAFIRKVYSILMLQLLVTFGFVVITAYNRSVKIYLIKHPMIFFIALVVVLVTSILITCFERIRRRPPYNYIFLGMFTVAESLLVAMMGIRFKTDAIMMAIGLTAILTLALTLFAMQTAFDFTAMGGVLLVLTLVLTIAGLILMFVPAVKPILIIYASAGALIFSFWLIYDTQAMLGGDRRYSISPEDYVFAALSIYMDIIAIFTYILMLLGLIDD